MNHKLDDLSWKARTDGRMLEPDDRTFFWGDNDKTLRWFHDPIQATDYNANGKATDAQVLDEDNEGY